MNETKKLSFDPLLLLFLGATPALGATADVRGALAMGCAVLLVMLLSALVLLALRRLIPENVRVPAALLVSAGFVSLVQLLMRALLPSLAQMLGLYLAVFALNALSGLLPVRIPAAVLVILSGVIGIFAANRKNRTAGKAGENS